jgi:hypothetical protein
MDRESIKPFLVIARAIQDDVATLELELPPDEGSPAKGQLVLSRTLTKGTRGYIERVAEQINIAFENGAFDASAVMVRRLVETLLVEAFEHHGIISKIKDPTTGDFFHLSKVVPIAIAETAKWNLSRNSKQALSSLKNLGDLSAHNRRFNAHRRDIERVRDGLRVVVQELISIADLK